MENFFGDRLREERVKLGLNQVEFGELGGVTKKTQILYEKNERSPDGNYLAAIAEKGADVLYILTGHKNINADDLDAELNRLAWAWETLDATLNKLGRAMPTEKKKEIAYALYVSSKNDPNSGEKIAEILTKIVA